MTLEDDLLKLVPKGEECRICTPDLAAARNVVSIQHPTKLSAMAAAGLIRRKKIEQATGSAFVYQEAGRSALAPKALAPFSAARYPNIGGLCAGTTLNPDGHAD